MGLLIKGDFETNFGKLSEIYLKIESIYFNRSGGKVKIGVTHWVNKQSADNFAKVYPDDPPKKNTGLLDEKVLVFDDNDEIKNSFVLPHSYETFLTSKLEVEVPIYDTIVDTIETSYVSFNENGEEEENKKVEQVTKQIQVGTEKIQKEVIDVTLLNDILPYCYRYIKSKLASILIEQELVDY